MWEACWAHYQTDYFHLFLCVAIIGVYGEDVVQQDLPADEMLLHFSSLSMHMSGEVVLRKVVLSRLFLGFFKVSHYYFISLHYKVNIMSSVYTTKSINRKHEEHFH